MTRMLAVDWGLKRSGLAWTDALGIIATALPPVDTSLLPGRIAEIIQQQGLSKLILGHPKRLDNTATHSTAEVEKFADSMRTYYPQLDIVLWDERFTSSMARDTLLSGGASRRQRADKNLINSVSAVILLQNYMEYLAQRPGI